MVKNWKISILLIEDEVYFRKHIADILSQWGIVTTTDNSNKAKELINKNYYDVVLIDIDLHGKDAGFGILKEAKRKGFFSIMLTDNDDEGFITKAYKIGCDHYLTKDQCENVIKFIIKDRLSEIEGSYSPNFFKKEYITQDESLISEISSLKNRLIGDKSILVLGETGVGKTKIVEHIHKMCGGTDDNFVSLNVSSISENLLESELFGHLKGSFTGADQSKKGLLQVADGGTLFLDEITSMPGSIQKKLLKCIEEKVFYPVGGIKPIKTNFRLVTSTCEDIYKLIQEKQFRIDLFYRINGIVLNIAPLRDRKQDIPLLTKHFMNKGSRQVVISDEAAKLLKNYSWPGNIRELKSVIENLTSKSNGEIKVSDLPDHIIENDTFTDPSVAKVMISQEHINFVRKFGMKAFIAKMEADMIFEVRKQYGKSQQVARDVLRLSRGGYYKLLYRAQDFINGERKQLLGSENE